MTMTMTMTDTTATANPSQEAVAALGILLTEARQQQGLERREVAAHLGLSSELVRGLEEGDLYSREAPIYVRGYLLRYARFLDLPEAEVLEHYRRLGLQEQPPLQPPADSRSAGISGLLRGFAYLLVFALVIGLGWLGVTQFADQFSTVLSPPPPATTAGAGRTDGTTTPATTVPTTATPAKPAEPVPTTRPAAVASAPAKPAEPASTAKPALTTPPPSVVAPPLTPLPPSVVAPLLTPAVSVPIPTTPPPATTAPVPSPPPPTATPAASQPGPTGSVTATMPLPAVPPPASLPPGHAQLVLELSGDSWVQIKDANGNRLAYDTFRKGATQTLTGPAPFTVILGNSGAVGITLDGKPIDPATYVKRGGVSRFELPAVTAR
jgi:cytoskeleton protein RodZ